MKIVNWCIIQKMGSLKSLYLVTSSYSKTGNKKQSYTKNVWIALCLHLFITFVHRIVKYFHSLI